MPFEKKNSKAPKRLAKDFEEPSDEEASASRSQRSKRSRALPTNTSPQTINPPSLARLEVTDNARIEVRPNFIQGGTPSNSPHANEGGESSGLGDVQDSGAADSPLTNPPIVNSAPAVDNGPALPVNAATNFRSLAPTRYNSLQSPAPVFVKRTRDGNLMDVLHHPDAYFPDTPRVAAAPAPRSNIWKAWAPGNNEFLQAVLSAIGIRPVDGEDWLPEALDWFRITFDHVETFHHNSMAIALCDKENGLDCVIVLSYYLGKSLVKLARYGSNKTAAYYIDAHSKDGQMTFVAVVPETHKVLYVTKTEFSDIAHRFGGLLYYMSRKGPEFLETWLSHYLDKAVPSNFSQYNDQWNSKIWEQIIPSETIIRLNDQTSEESRSLSTISSGNSEKPRSILKTPADPAPSVSTIRPLPTAVAPTKLPTASEMSILESPAARQEIMSMEYVDKLTTPRPAPKAAPPAFTPLVFQNPVLQDISSLLRSSANNEISAYENNTSTVEHPNWFDSSLVGGPSMLAHPTVSTTVPPPTLTSAALPAVQAWITEMDTYTKRHGSRFHIQVYVNKVIAIILKSKWNNARSISVGIPVFDEAIKLEPHIFLTHFKTLISLMFEADFLSQSREIRIDCPQVSEKNPNPFSAYCCTVIEYCEKIAATPAVKAKALVKGLKRHWSAIFNKLDATLHKLLKHDSDYTEETVEGIIVSIDNLSNPYVLAPTSSSSKLSAVNSSSSSESGKAEKKKDWKKKDWRNKNEKPAYGDKSHNWPPFKKKKKQDKTSLAAAKSEVAEPPAKKIEKID